MSPGVGLTNGIVNTNLPLGSPRVMPRRRSLIIMGVHQLLNGTHRHVTLMGTHVPLALIIRQRLG